jgi:hypothetical protein
LSFKGDIAGGSAAKYGAEPVVCDCLGIALGLGATRISKGRHLREASMPFTFDNYPFFEGNPQKVLSSTSVLQTTLPTLRAVAWHRLRLANEIFGLRVLAKAHKPTVPQVIIGSPFYEFELADKCRRQPQCRMLDYAASALASVAFVRSASFLFGINQTGYASAESCPVCSRQ